MDQNIIIMILFGIVALLVILLLVFRPWYLRDVTRRELIAEAKYNRMKEIEAEKIAQRYNKKGRL
jgi:uncharacterized membrane protein